MLSQLLSHTARESDQQTKPDRLIDRLTDWQTDAVTEKLKEMETEKLKRFTDRKPDKLKMTDRL